MTLAASMTADRRALAGAPALVRTAFEAMANNWGKGELEVVLPGGRRLLINGPQPGPKGVLEVKDYRFMRRVIGSGAIGFAEDEMNKLDAVHAYERGDFSVNAEHPRRVRKFPTADNPPPNHSSVAKHPMNNRSDSEDYNVLSECDP